MLWFTGLSGSGKSTIANLVEKRLQAMGRHTYLLDGDNVRHGLNKDLGFTESDRVENVRRVGEVAKLMVDAGLIVMTAFISPYRAERRLAQSLLAEGEFLEVHVDTPQGPVPQGAPRRAEELHRHRRALRGARAPGTARQHGRDQRRRSGRQGDRAAALAGDAAVGRDTRSRAAGPLPRRRVLHGIRGCGAMRVTGITCRRAPGRALHAIHSDTLQFSGGVLMRALSKSIVIALVVAATSITFAEQQTEEQRATAMRALGWQRGPTTGALGDKATVQTPKGTGFLSEADGSKFLELTGNLPSPGTSVLATDTWWAVFRFGPVGYVKDDEKIDADALLASIKAGDGPANEERRKRGLDEMHTEGWYIPPHYDPETKHLEWALRLNSPADPKPIINYTVRILGRTGVESVTLVSGTDTLDADVRALKAVLNTFNFNPGERYAEFRPGDHVAEFGLGALVAGGAAAVAVKSGLWKVLLGFLAASWKLVAAAVVGALAFVGKLFKKKPPQ